MAFEDFQELADKRCGDCGMLMSFQEFFRDNPSLTRNRAIDLWNDPLIQPYCLKCFLNAPEKPYKVKRRDSAYFYNKNF